MINMASIMLTAANKGFWKADAGTLRDLANTLGVLVVRYGPSCSAHVCGDLETIQRSRELMNPALAGSYSRAMQAALSGGGYGGQPSPASANARGRSKKPLFDFETDRLPSGAATPVDLVDVVLQRIQRMRDEDWGTVFLWLLIVLLPAGIVVFFLRDRYYRRHRIEPIRIIL